MSARFDTTSLVSQLGLGCYWAWVALAFYSNASMIGANDPDPAMIDELEKGIASGEFYKYDYNHGFSGGCSGYSYFTGYFAAQQAKAYIDSL